MMAGVYLYRTKVHLVYSMLRIPFSQAFILVQDDLLMECCQVCAYYGIIHNEFARYYIVAASFSKLHQALSLQGHVVEWQQQISAILLHQQALPAATSGHRLLCTITELSLTRIMEKAPRFPTTMEIESDKDKGAQLISLLARQALECTRPVWMKIYDHAVICSFKTLEKCIRGQSSHPPVFISCCTIMNITCLVKKAEQRVSEAVEEA